MTDSSGYEIGLGIELGETVHLWTETAQLSIDGVLELRQGRYVFARFAAQPTIDHLEDGVTGEALREVALGSIIEDSARDRDAEETIRTTGRRIIEEAGGLTRESLEVVATAYRYGYAISGGESPTREVMQLLGLTRSKASRWIAEAREDGILGGTTERKPGAMLAVEAQRDRVQRLRADVAKSQAALDLQGATVDQAERDLERAFATDHYPPVWVAAESARDAYDRTRENLAELTSRLAEAQRELDRLEAEGA